MAIEWTHKKLLINDIRKVKNFYIISLSDKKITSPIFVDDRIFERRLKSYYLKNNIDNIKREDILNIKWNMIINKGFFEKYNQNNDIEKIYKDPNKFYISFLEIDGPLGMYVPK